MQIAPLLHVGRGVTAIIGGGGKTTLMETLAGELSKKGKVIITTTTHICRPKQYETLLDADEAAVSAALERSGIVCVASQAESGKLCAPWLSMGTLAQLADFVLVEADGAKRLPCKVPAAHEPVLLPESDIVQAVAGLSALGRPLQECCFRTELACALLGVPPETCLTPDLLARLLACGQGGRKGVGTRAFGVVLNQADTPERTLLGKQSLKILWEQDRVRGVLTHFDEGERA